MQGTTDNLGAIIPLSYEVREEAYQTARNRLAGTQTDMKQFRKGQLSKYPPRLVKLAYGLLILLMVAAFIPSAISLYYSGNREFCKSLISVTDGTAFTSETLKDETIEPANPLCVAAGGAEVAMAETGQLVFLIALAIIDPIYHPTKMFGRDVNFSLGATILWLGALLSTLIAIVGNAHFGQPWKHGGWLFDYIKTFVPPLLVMGIGYVLKELFLNSVKENFEVTAKYNQAEEERLVLYNNPESAPNWNRFLSYALREAIIAQNRVRKQKEAVKALTDEEWRFIIRREYSRMNWEVNLAEESLIEKVQNAASGEQTQALEKKVQLATAPPGQRKEGAGYLLWVNDQGLWTGQSKLSSQIVGEQYADSQSAYHAVYNHNKKYK